jgi:hypothetical protein
MEVIGANLFKMSKNLLDGYSKLFCAQTQLKNFRSYQKDGLSKELLRGSKVSEDYPKIMKYLLKTLNR